MNWQDASEIVCGKLWCGQLAINAVRHDLLFPPYDEIVKRIAKGDSKEDIILSVGINPIQSSIDAVESLNGLGNADWLGILEQTAIAHDAGMRLEKFGKKLQKGDEVDWGTINFIADKAQNGTGGKFVPLSEIEGLEVPFKKTGFVAIDEHLGGLPEVGQVIVAAAPGSGKTTFMADLASCWAIEHPQEKVAIFTLEMMARELKMRFSEVMHLTKEQQSRILVNDDILTPEEVISYAATIENLGLVCIDFADLLISGETTESTMAHIYRSFMLGAKKLGCPIVLLSQLSRNYDGGIPRPNHIRYTGLAEALAWMILMLYNPNTDWFAEEDADILPPVGGRAYILAWKVRGGFRLHKKDSPGAIQVNFKGDKGWRTNHPGNWFSLQKAI